MDGMSLLTSVVMPTLLAVTTSNGEMVTSSLNLTVLLEQSFSQKEEMEQEANSLKASNQSTNSHGTGVNFKS